LVFAVVVWSALAGAQIIHSVRRRPVASGLG
jgi:hypothetical protein